MNWNKPSMEKLKRGSVLAALIAAAAVFAVMLQIEKNLLRQGEKKTVIVAVSGIPKGQILEAGDGEQCFVLQEVEVGLIPESAVQSLEALDGKMAVYGIEAGTILTTGMLSEVNEIIEDMEEPVIAGFKADDLYQVVGGVLRKGDRIHVFSVSEEQGVRLVWENLFIQAVFDQTGNQITNDDTLSAAQRINVFMDKCDIESFYAQLSSGTLRVVKVYE
ncbi:MAG: SAF domain-containing protein [Acetatifactor sp.]